MKPLAVPTAGGVLSAIVLFATLVSALNLPAVSANDDIPTALYTHATVKNNFVPLGFQENEVAVDLIIDQHGRIVSYTIPGVELLVNETAVRRNIENSLLFTEFIPATTFGQPVASRTRISFRSSRIDVKG